MKASAGVKRNRRQQQPRDHTRGKQHFDLTRQRLRELERIIKSRGATLETDDADLYLLPIAQCILSIRQKKQGHIAADALRKAIEFWASERQLTPNEQLLQSVVDGALQHPRALTADALGARLCLTYDERHSLAVRTIGACDADKAERARRAKQRKRDRERERIVAKRRAAGVVPREEFLASSLRRRQPWAALGMSERDWYRKGRPDAGRGVLLGLGRGVLPVGGKGALADNLLHVKRHTSADEPPARGTGNPRAAHPPSEPRAPAVEVTPRLASAPPHGAVASEPPRHTHQAEGRYMLLLQKWGAKPEAARALVEHLMAAAGAARRDHVGELFDIVERHYYGRRRIEWLRGKAALMERFDYYRVERKLPSAALRAKREAVLDVLRRSPQLSATTAEIVAATGENRVVVFGRLRLLLRDGEIVRVRPGLFALSGAAPADYRPASVAVLEALAGENELKEAPLIAATGKPRSAVAAALLRLIGSDKVVRVRRGVFALPTRKLRVQG